MSELIRRGDFMPTATAGRTSRTTSKALEQVREQAAIGVARELGAAEIVGTRMWVGSALSKGLVHRIADLHREITEESRGDQFLEMELREIEVRFTRQSVRLLDTYMDRPL